MIAVVYTAGRTPAQSLGEQVDQSLGASESAVAKAQAAGVGRDEQIAALQTPLQMLEVQFAKLEVLAADRTDVGDDDHGAWSAREIKDM